MTHIVADTTGNIGKLLLFHLVACDNTQLLLSVDALVDGPFVEELRDEQLIFRGSFNQRILYAEEIVASIDIKAKAGSE